MTAIHKSSTGAGAAVGSVTLRGALLGAVDEEEHLYVVSATNLLAILLDWGRAKFPHL